MATAELATGTGAANDLDAEAIGQSVQLASGTGLSYNITAQVEVDDIRPPVLQEGGRPG